MHALVFSFRSLSGCNDRTTATRCKAWSSSFLPIFANLKTHFGVLNEFFVQFFWLSSRFICTSFSVYEVCRSVDLHDDIAFAKR